jgi:PKD repeat protein
MPGYAGSGRTKGRLLAAAVFGLAIAVAPLAADSISYTPPAPNVDQNVLFSYVSPSPPGVPLRWEFGDGGYYLSAPGFQTASHVYSAAGTYAVRARVMTAGAPAPWITTTIVIAERRTITYAPPNPLPGMPVTFTANNFFSANIRWNFGEGLTLAGHRQEVHTYQTRGTFTVQAWDLNGRTASPITALVVVGGPPSIAVSPSDLRVNAPVEFRAVNFTSTSLIRWDFGDGTIENDTGPPVISHVYRTTGVFTVRAYDNGGAVQTAIVVVRVLPERLITMTPADPRVGEEAVFRAVNFNSSSLRWDFGDGTILDPAGTQVGHAYQTAGPFTVRAFEPAGAAQVMAALPVTVYPAQGPRARFSVSYVHLRFEDGKAYRTIPKNFDGLTAFAEIKFEGTGMLQAQWLVDGLPFKTVLTSLAFAGSTIIDSGRIPGLPSVISGLHDVTLNIIMPKAEFSVPVIRYFVTAEPATSGSIEMVLSGAEDLEGSTLESGPDVISAPPGAPFLVKGAIRNEGGNPVLFGLLRVFLNEELVDQKLIRDLRPGEERAFVSSVPYPAAERRRLVLVLYDISRKPAPILYYRETAVVPAKGVQRIR